MEPEPDAVAPLTHLTASEQAFRESVRAFAERSLRPRVAPMDRAGEMPRALLDELFAEGLMALEVPRSLGGAQRGFFASLLAIEELARVDPGVAVCVDVQNALVNGALLRWGTAEQQQRYLPRLASDMVGAYAVSEREAGSDAFALSARAERVTDGFVLNGRKHWITNAAEAGLFLVFANAAPEQGAKGITVFLVERDQPGLSVGAREDKLGIRASSTCELVLERVRVSDEAVLGGLGGGSRLAVESLSDGRIGIAAQMLGLAQGAFDAAFAWARSRQQFGQAIIGFQGVQFPLARVATEIEAARLLVYNAGRLRAAGAGTLERFRAAAMAKYFASQVAERAASESLEVFGGQGFVKACPAEKFYRDAKIGKIYEGTSNMQLRTIMTTLLSAR